jgi:hypothetical protein
MAVGEKTREAADTAADKARGAGKAAKSTATQAGSAVKDTAGKARSTAKAVRAARAGKVDEARQAVEEADLDSEGMAAKAVAEAEEMHYQVVVNKRGFNARSLSKALNERWDSGWRLGHILEQRGNTVLVFEKREDDGAPPD